MISFDLTLSKFTQGKRGKFDKALGEREGWHKHEVDTTWSKELVSSNVDDAFEEVTESFRRAARCAKITKYKAVAHIGNMEQEIPPLPSLKLNQNIQEFISNLGRKQKSVGGR